ncbi:MAG: hypothetical protein DBX58_01355 [Clostridiales bacterium]|nr:MAG: hypothetical protein DBX58_01355 [Clostridiales bacterium]
MIWAGSAMKPFYEAIDPNLAFQVEKVYNLSFPAHWHKEFELFFLCSGHVTVNIENQVRTLSEGDLVVVNCDTIHYYDEKDNDSVAIIIIFNPDEILGLYQWLENGYQGPCFLKKQDFDRISPHLHRRIKSLFLETEQEFVRQQQYYNWMITSKIVELSALLLRHFSNSASPVSVKKTSGSIHVVKSAMTYIQEYHTEPLTLESVSNHMGFNPYYFSKLFKKYAGLGFKDYLNRIRIEHANALLETSDEEIAAIAYKCGFNSIRTFNRIYKSVYNHSPSQKKHHP